MNRDDIVRWAQEAGLWLFNDSEGHCDGITNVELITAEKDRDDDRLVEILMPFANLVAAAEREACAKVCDELVTHAQTKGDTDAMFAAIACAFAIRERGAP